jgi:mannose-6-phosphate isomerase-like protein (cupin superfamily)
VVRGTANVTIDGQVAKLPENESIYIPIGAVHRMGNPGKIDLEMIEVQTGRSGRGWHRPHRGRLQSCRIV